MANKIEGTPEEMLATVQDLVRKYVPDATCELQKYKTEIGCGALDQRGILREANWSLRGITDWRVQQEAQALASHVR